MAQLPCFAQRSWRCGHESVSNLRLVLSLVTVASGSTDTRVAVEAQTTDKIAVLRLNKCGLRYDTMSKNYATNVGDAVAIVVALV